MASDTPSVAKADYPSFLGYAYDDQWDQGTKVAPNEDYVDAWWLSQIQSELLAHQQLLQAGAAQLFSPELMGTPAANPAVISELSNGVAIMTFVDASTTSVLLNAQVLAASTDVIIVWSATPTSGDVVWQAEYLETADNADMDAAFASATTTDAVSAVADGQVKTTISLTGLTVGNTLLLKISRLGGDGSDTLAATANAALIKLEKA